MENLDRVSFDIPRTLLQELQSLQRKDEDCKDMASFWMKWMPRFRDMVRDWNLNDAFTNDCVDKLRLRDEASR